MKRIAIKILVTCALVAAAAAAVMLLWNFVMPTTLGCGALSYLQALALFALMRLLFGRFGSRDRGRELKLRLDPTMRNRVKGMNREQRREYIEQYMQQQ